MRGPIARTESSIPIGTAFYPIALGSINLTEYGYAEEEYFLSGTANVHQYDAIKAAERADVPPSAVPQKVVGP